MTTLIEFVNAFWTWTGYAECYKGCDVEQLSVDPFDFPLLCEMQQACIELINKQLSIETTDAFLMCMAIDNECECILDACTALADESFLNILVSTGIHHSQSHARWQIAELLRRDVPNRIKFLNTLLHDEDSYVRKRAHNVLCDIAWDPSKAYFTD